MLIAIAIAIAIITFFASFVIEANMEDTGNIPGIGILFGWIMLITHTA